MFEKDGGGGARENDEKAREDIRFVTARDLGRHTAKLLDEVGRGIKIVVTRRGAPCASLVATENLMLLERARRPSPTESFEEEELDLDSFELPAEAWTVLELFARLRNVDVVVSETDLSVQEVLATMSRLELRKLVALTPGGYRVTSLGRRALAQLDQARD
ncbi:MAG TPA: type II toxin-antitoxin system prevent-host-death family antitoxin [Actinomycetota bacterium]|nr:type II toxin-antitoxin system prevent-host-death family antitoxin [Actinomycetota bacterium]